MAHGKRRSSYQYGGSNKIRRLGPVSASNFYGLANSIAGALVSKKAKKAKSKAGNKTSRKTKFRGTGSRTNTHTHNKRRDDVIQQAEGMVTKDCGVIQMYKKPYKHGKTLGKYEYQNSNNWVVQGIQGQQVVDYMEQLFNRAQLLGPFSSVRNDRGLIADDLFTLNPFYQIPASALYSATTGVPRTDILYMKEVNVGLHLLSMTQYPQVVKIYWMTPVFDTNTAPIEAWDSILAAKRNGQINQTVASTLGAINATAGFASIGDVEGNPFHHKEFRKQWKALKAHHLVLQAGEQVNLNVSFDYEKVVAKESLELRTNLYLKGISVYPMIIAHGGLVGLSPDDPTKCTEVGYGAVKIGTLMNYKMRFGALGQSRFSTARTYDGNISGFTGSKKVIDDEDDIITADVL